MIRAAALLLASGAAACSDTPPTIIDGSSSQAFEQSLAAARRDLPDAERLAFDAAIRQVPARRYAERDPAAAARVAFDGMTAVEVVAIERERIGRK